MSKVIDLGKLRFHFAGDWSVSTQYEANDIVKYGGNVYVYTYALKSAGTLPTDTSRWALMVEGFNFEGVFDETTSYQIGDGISHGGKVYIAIKDSYGVTPPNAEFWSQFVDGIQYEGEYSNTASYQKNDIVTYGGSTFIAIQDTTGTNPVVDVAFWNKFVEGISPSAVYNEATSYVPNDLVAYGANIYRAISNTVGNLPTNTTYWEQFVSGVAFKGAYSNNTQYYLNDIVNYGANAYRAIQDTAGNLPTNVSFWELLIPGFSYEGNWSSATSYFVGQIVTYGGSLYQANVDNTNDNPYTGISWTKVSGGINNKGDWSTATEYATDDVVTHGGNTYICIVPHASVDFLTDLAGNNWKKYNSGVRYRGVWDVNTSYLTDDIVQSGSSTYIAVTEVIGGDAPFNGTNLGFELFAAGAEGFISRSGDTMTGPLLSHSTTPVNDLELAAKGYVDAIQHNNLVGLAGGSINENEYYHLNQTQYNLLTSIQNFSDDETLSGKTTTDVVSERAVKEYVDNIALYENGTALNSEVGGLLGINGVSNFSQTFNEDGLPTQTVVNDITYNYTYTTLVVGGNVSSLALSNDYVATTNALLYASNSASITAWLAENSIIVPDAPTQSDINTLYGESITVVGSVQEINTTTGITRLYTVNYDNNLNITSIVVS